MKISHLFYPVLLMLLLGGCSRNVDGTWKAPFIYRIDVQQGNVVDQEMINKLKPGMDRNQVKFILGTPLMTDPFHSDRWDYVYSFEPGRGERQQRRITVYFKDDKLSHVDGDIQPVERVVQDDAKPKERSVDVPLERYEEGLFSKMFDRDDDNKTGLPEPAATTGDEEVTATESDPSESQTETETTATGQADSEPSTGTETLPARPSDPMKAETEAEKEITSANTARGSTLATDQDKNLLRRFWDRMTSGESQSGVEDGEETERDLRDAEVFKDAGGDL